MAKISGVIIPKASGSIGNITFRTAGRETIASEKITSNESRTEAQVNQRIYFKSAMEILRNFTMAARYLYKRTGFKTAFSKFCSIGLATGAEGWDEYYGNGYAFADAAWDLYRPIVEGEVKATKVVYDNTGLIVSIYVPMALVEPRKNGDQYKVTAAHCVFNYGENLDAPVPLIYTPSEDDVDAGIEDDSIVINVRALPFAKHEAENWNFFKTYVPCVSINGKRVGLDRSAAWSGGVPNP